MLIASSFLKIIAIYAHKIHPPQSWYGFFTTWRKADMKNTQSQTPQANTQFNANKKRPEVRDNLDSRKNEEQEFKGDDVTHNEKPHHNNKKQDNQDKNK